MDKIIKDSEAECFQGMSRVLSNVLYNYPNSEQLNVFSQSELGNNWPITCNASKMLQRVLDDWDKASNIGKSNMLLDLKVDYGQLFFGPGSPKAAPWSSVYTSSTGLLNEKSTTELMSFLRVNNIKVTTRYNEPLDHIGLILSVVDGLLQKLVVDKDNIRANALLFILVRNHLLPWSGKCLRLAKKYAKTEYYRCFAILADEFIKSILKQPLSNPEYFNKYPSKGLLKI